MHTDTTMLIHAPRAEVFRVTAELTRWPEHLPHYRWIRVLRRDGPALVVKMAARRGWLPIQWTSCYEPDAAAVELRFRHLRSFTKGMNVTWTFTPVAGNATLVRIVHDLPRGNFFARWFATHVLARHFIEPVATNTLAAFKRLLENSAHPAVSHVVS